MRRTKLLAIFLVLSTWVVAQVNKSNLTGIVRDGTGAAVPGVTMKLTSIGTGAVRTETRDASGFYRFTLLDRGAYRLETQYSGFKRFREDPVELQTGETTSMPPSHLAKSPRASRSPARRRSCAPRQARSAPRSIRKC